MRFVPVPGYGVPTHAIPLLDKDANLTAWLDRQIFSAPHLYERTRDPEGLLSTLPALATALIGVLTGIWLRTPNAIVAYVFSELLAAVFFSIRTHPGVTLAQSIFRSIQHVVPNVPFASLLYSVAFVAVCWAFVAILYRRQIFIKI
jgi:predicted acyltransferase